MGIETITTITQTITLAGGVGSATFNAWGIIDSAWLSPRSPNASANYSFNIYNNDTASGIYAEQNITGARLEVIGRATTGSNSITIDNSTAAAATFDVVIRVITYTIS